MDYYVIRKYENRKFYDAAISKTVTLDELVEYSNMENLKILDPNGKDITTETLLLGIGSLFKKRRILGKITKAEFRLVRGFMDHICEVLL